MHFKGYWVKPRKTSDRKVCLQAKIRTAHLLNANQKRYHLRKLIRMTTCCLMGLLVTSGETATSIFTVGKYVTKAKMMQDPKREESSSSLYFTQFLTAWLALLLRRRRRRVHPRLWYKKNRIRRDRDRHSSSHGYVKTSDVTYEQYRVTIKEINTFNVMQ